VVPQREQIPSAGQGHIWGCDSSVPTVPWYRGEVELWQKGKPKAKSSQCLLRWQDQSLLADPVALKYLIYFQGRVKKD